MCNGSLFLISGRFCPNVFEMDKRARISPGFVNDDMCIYPPLLL